jgi:hypothetical protein
MRNWIIGAAAAIAAVAAPGVAAAQHTGYVDLGYTQSSLDQSGFDQDIDTVAVSGSVAFGVGGLGVQLDGRFGNAEPDSGSDIDFWGIGGHVYKRSNNWLLGGYVGFGNLDSGTDIDEWTVAAEGQYYLERTTLDAALSYSDADDANIESTAIDFGARHFVTDNFSIGGNLGFANLESTGTDLDATTLGVDAEYQLSSLPLSIFGGYQHSEVDDANIDVDSFGVGVRWNFGGQTLIDRDRSGAGLRRRGGVFSRILGGAV